MAEKKAKPAAPPKAAQQTLVIKVETPRAQSGGPAMAKARKRRTYAPSKRRIERGGGPGVYGTRTAAQTGASGAARLAQLGYAPKERSGPAVIVVNPQNPQQGRVVRIGKRGGAYGQGGTPKTRWGSLDTIKSALPGVAAVTAVAGAGLVALRDTKTVRDLARKLPGGLNTLTFIGGAAAMYVAYKYRSLIFFLSGLGIGLYALIKFATREASFNTLEEEELALEESASNLPGGATPDGGSSSSPAKKEPVKDPTEGKPAAKVGPSSEDQAKKLIQEGNRIFAEGDFKAAFDSYQAAEKKFNDPLIQFNMGRALHKMAEEAANKNIEVARSLASSAKTRYILFNNGSQNQGSAFANEELLSSMRSQARGFIRDIDSFLSLPEDQATAAVSVQGQVLAGEEDGLDDQGYPLVAGPADPKIFATP